MSRLEPKYPYLGVKRLGWIMRSWHHNRISDAHASKMLRLWLGMEFKGYMDEKGRISSMYFNEIRKYLSYKTVMELIDDIRRSQSFFIFGSGEEDIQGIASPLWFVFDKNIDKKLLSGSIRPGLSTEDNLDDGSRKSSRKCDSSNINIYNYPTGGNPDGLSLREGVDENTKDAQQINRDKSEARRVVREYFRWVQQQTDEDHKALVNDILLKLMEPRNLKGELIENQQLNREDAARVLNILFSSVLPDVLSPRDKFFEAQFMKHPEKRIYWMRNLMKKNGYKHIARARELFSRRKDVVLELEQQEQAAREEQNRPLSPYEWQDAQGQRWYRWQGSRLTIPADAPLRPGDAVQWNRIVKEWR